MWDNGKQIAEYEYHGDGTIKRLQCDSLYTEYDYDIDRNLTGIRTMLGDEVIADNHYRYDGNGNRLEKQQKYGTTRYTYDSMNRLAKVEYPDRKEELFYDKAGNRTRRIMNGMEELYRYDKRNRLTEYTKGGATHQFSYDNAGNLIRDDRAKYEYDAFNRNTKVETFNGNIQINHYDAEGLRHEMEENGRLVSFIFRGTEVVTEETKEDRIRYIRTNELLASDAESARTYYHYASDEIGNITHVVEDNHVLNHYEYDVWGNLTVCEETVENRFKYNGQQFDPISQQYYLRARYYNPVIGRFTQEDTYRGDGLNLYAYCRNNPVFYIDPSGHMCEKGVDRVTGEINTRTATKDDVKNLSSHIREKLRNGGTLTDQECRVANQLGIDVGRKSGSNSDNYVYRALNQKDYERYTNGMGLEAKNPNGNWSLNEHLVNGSGKASWANDPYISTTSDLSVAKGFNQSGSGYGIVKIDMNKVTSASYKGYEIYPRVNGVEGLPYHYSVWQQETSVYQSIPFEAIVGYFN